MLIFKYGNEILDNGLFKWFKMYWKFLMWNVLVV